MAGPLRSVSGLLLGAQVGALTGMLSQRVLGQYDVSLLDPGVPPRLLLLAPNLGQAAAQPRAGRRGADAVGDDPRDHARGPVLRGAVAAGARRRDAERAARRGCRSRSAQTAARRRSSPGAGGVRARMAAAPPRSGRAARHARPRAARRAAAAHARRGPLAPGRADAGDDVPDRGSRRARDGRRRRRGAALAAAAAGRDDAAAHPARPALARARAAARPRAEDAPVRDRADASATPSSRAAARRRWRSSGPGPRRCRAPRSSNSRSAGPPG